MLAKSNESTLIFINTLICHVDIERALVCLKTFVLACENQIAIRFFSDGSVTAEDIAALKAEFSSSQFYERDEVVEAVSPMIEAFPHCREMTNSSAFGLKLIEMPLYCQHVLAEKSFVYIDSDIMFFRALTNWRELWERNVFLSEHEGVLSGRPSVILKQTSVLSDLNSGLIAINSKWHDLKLIEWYLGQEAMRDANTGLSEQTCWAILGARAQSKGARVWQIAPYQVVVNRDFRELRPKNLALHFIGPLKSRIPEFQAQGLRKQSTSLPPATLHFQPAKRLTLAHPSIVKGFLLAKLHRLLKPKP